MSSYISREALEKWIRTESASLDGEEDREFVIERLRTEIPAIEIQKLSAVFFALQDEPINIIKSHLAHTMAMKLMECWNFELYQPSSPSFISLGLPDFVLDKTVCRASIAVCVKESNHD